MPIYEYVCNACGHEFEEWQKISDAPVNRCPSCGKRKVERLVSLSSFHLKGTGWYVTDYANRNHGNRDAKPSKNSDSKKGEKTEKSESPEPKKKESETKAAASKSDE
jgi:putative FmdB family regulatory protein